MKRFEVHVIAGLGGHLFARGTRALDRLFDKLSDDWDAVHWLHQSYEQIGDGIIERQRKFKDKPVVVLVGHSYGALRCQQIAARLSGVGIEVEYIAAIDPTALPLGHIPMIVPQNVGFVDEFWSTTGLFNFPLWRRKWTPDGQRGGKYIYPAHWKGERRIWRIPGGHIPTASDEKTVKVIMEKMRELNHAESVKSMERFQ